MRQAIWLPFASLFVLVIVGLLIASYAGTRVLARRQADALMAAAVRETDARLHRVFDPIRQKVLEDYASVRLGRYSTDDHATLKDRLFPDLFALAQVDSLMVGDLTGSQFLIMRYTPAVLAAPVLAPVADQLPPAPADRSLQFFTRDFRPSQWGETSHWILWDSVGHNAVKQWELPLPGYDGRLRPWHQAAMAKFADLPLDQAHAAGSDLIAWTEVYPLFTTQKPGISASIAARDPAGRVLIVAYDLLLDEIAQFSATACPTPNGQLLVLTDDDRVLGPPRDARADANARQHAAIIRPVGEAGYSEAAQAVAIWRQEQAHRTGQFRLEIAGQAWWAGFAPFDIGSGRLLWISVLLPETDLVPAATAHQQMILVAGLLALGLAAAAAALVARFLSAPLVALATQARRIAGLDLGSVPPIHTPVAELAQLSDTLAETRESLRQRVAEREKALQDLATSERQLRTLAENTPDIVARFDRALRHLFVNPAHTVTTGLSPDRVIGRTLAEIGYPADTTAVWARAIEQVFATQQPARFEYAFPTPSGQRYFEARLIYEHASPPGADTVLTVVRDISERVHAAAALLHSQTRYRTLVDAALVGILVHQDGVIRFANPAAVQILGYANLDEFVDHISWTDFVAPAAQSGIHERTQAAMRGEDPPLHPGWQLLRHDGSRRWVQSSVTSIEWDGRPALLSFLRDITELRAATEQQTNLEEQLRHAQKLEAVGLLAGGIAHDFNNLLQIIGGNAQLAAMSDDAPAERLEALHEINKTVQRAALMTRQLLAFSRRQALSREAVELNAFVAEHVQMLRRLIPENIRLDLRPAAAPLGVFADRGQLAQVILNLCLNARDAMPKGGQLTIQLAGEILDQAGATRLGRPVGTAFARLTITDTGHGMDKATLDRIFDPFFTTKPRDKGTGLGLAVVYGIVHQHEGHIEVSSHPGDGAQVAILLPQSAGQAAPAPREQEPAAPPARNGGTILLAEDSEPIRNLAVTTLRQAGYTVHAVADGHEALETFRAAHTEIDLLFFDVMMPGLGGFEAAQQCRAIVPGIPVIFASGYAAESVAEGENIPAGAQMLQKPYRIESLLVLVDRFLATHPT